MNGVSHVYTCVDSNYQNQPVDFKLIYITILDKKKVKVCDSCGSLGDKDIGLSTCPFGEEIHDDYTTLCRCCETCVQNCCDDI